MWDVCCDMCQMFYRVNLLLFLIPKHTRETTFWWKFMPVQTVLLFSFILDDPVESRIVAAVQAVQHVQVLKTLAWSSNWDGGANWPEVQPRNSSVIQIHHHHCRLLYPRKSRNQNGWKEKFQPPKPSRLFWKESCQICQLMALAFCLS